MTPEEELQYTSALAALDIAIDIFTQALTLHSPELAAQWALGLTEGIRRVPRLVPPDMAPHVTDRLAGLAEKLLAVDEAAPGVPPSGHH